MYLINQSGRSMIETLGVLAIVGVLSVAGISGYNKAMSEYRISRLIGDYSLILNHALEHSSFFMNSAKKAKTSVQFAKIFDDTGWLPKNWSRSNNTLYDGYFHRKVTLYSVSGQYLDFSIGLTQAKTRSKIKTEDIRLCQRIISDFVKQYHEVIYQVKIYETGTDQAANRVFAYGKDYCGQDKKCLFSLTPGEILEACKLCIGEKNNCNMILLFKS